MSRAPNNGESLLEGTVKWFSEESGYGFIEVSGNSDHFVHAKAVRPGWIPRQGDRVVFESASTSKAPRALNVHASSAAGQTPNETKPGPGPLPRLFEPLRFLFKRNKTQAHERSP